jgi:tetratricopeptide (TPR) repeat protein
MGRLLQVIKILLIFFLSLGSGFSKKTDPPATEWFFSSKNQKPFFMQMGFPSGNTLTIQYSAQKNLKILFLDSQKKLLISSDAVLRTLIFWDEEQQKHVFFKERTLSFEYDFDKEFHKALKLILEEDAPSYTVDLRKLQTMFTTHAFLKQKNTGLYQFHDKDTAIQIEMGPLYPSKITITREQKTIEMRNITADKDVEETPWKGIQTPEHLEEVSVNSETVKQLLTLFSRAASGTAPTQEFLDKLPHNLWNILQAKPRDEVTRVNLILYLLQKKAYDQASQLTEEGLTLNDTAYIFWLLKGMVKIPQMKLGIAIEALEEALRIKPKDFSATFTLAKTHILLANAKSLKKARLLFASLTSSPLYFIIRKKCERDLKHISELEKTL